MSLVVKPAPFYLPSYSLTTDVLGFIRCGLQYRYQGVGRIPSTRPFQLWFGEFIHGVLEEAYRQYNQSVREGNPTPPPWNPLKIYQIGKEIEQSLRDRKITPNNRQVRKLGYLRAVKAVNDLGPDLFPLISEVEIPLSATRNLLPIPDRYKTRDIRNYEITGRVDVITSVELNDPAHQNNGLVRYIVAHLNQEIGAGRLPGLPNEFEIIIDYKGARRPPIKTGGNGSTDYWQVYGWQVKTYTHIRSRQPGSKPVALGIIIYLNELLPTWEDISRLKNEINVNQTDITPSPGSLDWNILNMQRPPKRHPDFKKNRKLSWDFRIRRALRLVSVSDAEVGKALNKFDRYVRQIEISHSKEKLSCDILQSWPKNNSDPDTCTACDYASFCTKYHQKKLPSLPA